MSGPKPKWMGSVPEACDLCHRDLKLDGVFIDGKTVMGPWGCLCGSCHRSHGVGLGTGQGQKYEFDTACEEWFKTEG